jgi:hypothetical protein
MNMHTPAELLRRLRILVRGLLFGVGTSDPVSFVLAPLLLGTTALIACVIPALRGTRVDPNAVLRGD